MGTSQSAEEQHSQSNKKDEELDSSKSEESSGSLHGSVDGESSKRNHLYHDALPDPETSDVSDTDSISETSETNEDDDWGENPLLGNSGRSNFHVIYRGKQRIKDFWDVMMHNPRGGDIYNRLGEAFRTSLGSFFVFLALILQNDTFPSLWIGNKFQLSTVGKGTFGGSTIFTRNVLCSLIVVVGITWPVNLLIRNLVGLTFSLVFPAVTACMTVLILVCPWLEEKNLMLEFMYLVIQAGTRGQGITPMYPLALFGTCTIGCLIAVAMNLLPLPRPAFASFRVEKKLLRVQEDFEVLLSGIRMFVISAGSDYEQAREAVSSIELGTDKLSFDVDVLEKHLDAAKWEVRTFLTPGHYHMVLNWIAMLDKQQMHGRMIRFAVNRRLLGEQATNFNPDLKDAKTQMAAKLKDCADDLVETCVEATRFCTSCVSVTNPRKHKRMTDDHETVDELRSKVLNSLRGARKTIKIALDDAESSLDEACSDEVNSPAFAFVIRRIQLCQGIFAFSNELTDFIETNLVDQDIKDEIVPFYARFRQFITQPWPVTRKEDFRLPMKAAFGMVIASLFIAVPAMYDIAAPNAVWPAITVASVNLSTTGSSFVKAMDRLRGTFIASALALILTEFFSRDSPLRNDFVKVPSIAIFTFVLTYLKDTKHAYKYKYAAQSIGSMLYGSVSYDYAVQQYIPKRIALIFLGVLIFIFVEMVLFPRSSREIVQRGVLHFFPSVKSFLDKAASAVDALSDYEPEKALEETRQALEAKKEKDKKEKEENNPDTPADAADRNLNPLGFGAFDGGNEEEPNQRLTTYEKHAAKGLKKLNEHLDGLRDVVSSTEEELVSAFTEPYLGFELQMSKSKYRKLISIQKYATEQASLLLKIVQGLQQCFLREIGRDSPIRDMEWPSFYADSSRIISKQLGKCIHGMKKAFPDGCLRPQKNNGQKALNAAIQFRNFEDVRLQSLWQWCTKYTDFIKLRKEKELEFLGVVDSLDLRVYLAVSESLVLEICQLLQDAGNVVEEIAREYPRATSDIRNRLPRGKGENNTHELLNLVP